MSGDLRSLVDAARKDAPAAGDRARMSALLGARLAAAVPSTSPSAGAGKAGLSGAAKVAVSPVILAASALVLGLSTFGAGYWVGHERAPDPPPAAPVVAASPQVARVAPSPQTVAMAESPPIALDPPKAPIDEAAPSRRPTRPAPAPQIAPRAELLVDEIAPSANVEPAPQDPAPASTLGAELALLRRAQESLRDGDAASALRFVGELDGTHPRGVLAAERDALRVLALCAAGRLAEARAATDRFRREHPGSPHAARVDASCGASAP